MQLLGSARIALPSSESGSAVSFAPPMAVVSRRHWYHRGRAADLCASLSLRSIHGFPRLQLSMLATRRFEARTVDG
jgi:hypothetical protein